MLFSCLTKASQPPRKPLPFPIEERAALGRRPIEHIIFPIKKVLSESPEPDRSRADSRVARVRRRAVEQRQQSHFLALRHQQPGHLIGHIAAETVSAYVIWALRLDF